MQNERDGGKESLNPHTHAQKTFDSPQHPIDMYITALQFIFSVAVAPAKFDLPWN